MTEPKPSHSKRRRSALLIAAGLKLVASALFIASQACREDDQQAAYDQYAKDHAERECQLLAACGDQYAFSCEAPVYEFDECDYFDDEVATACLGWLDDALEQVDAVPPSMLGEMCESIEREEPSRCPNPVDPGEMIDASTCVVSPE